MHSIIKNGKTVKVNNCGKIVQDRMIRSGWILKLSNVGESAQAVYDRLAAENRYSDIKVYWEGTRIQGLHKFFAFVKEKPMEPEPEESWLVKMGNVTLVCTGVKLTAEEIQNGFLQENVRVFWSDDRCKHYFFDFVVAIKDGKKIWCESVEINNELTVFAVNFYEGGTAIG